MAYRYLYQELAPVMEDENGENQISYNKWHKFQGAGMGTARIYYTEVVSGFINSNLSCSSVPNFPYSLLYSLTAIISGISFREREWVPQGYIIRRIRVQIQELKSLI